jgi:hypothetical protein
VFLEHSEVLLVIVRTGSDVEFCKKHVIPVFSEQREGELGRYVAECLSS